MHLTQGKEYVLEFDARSVQPRYIEPKVGRDSSDYSKIGPRQITPTMTHHSYSFIMQDPSDYDASVVFGVGLYGCMWAVLFNYSHIKKSIAFAFK